MILGPITNRVTVPPTSPQEQGRVHSMQAGLPVPGFDASSVSFFFFYYINFFTLKLLTNKIKFGRYSAW